jgi:putative CocE/NonD family hydrolase
VHFESETSLWYQQNMELPFFNYYLKGKGSVDKIAEANVFFTGENKWHQLQTWPPKNMQVQSWALRSNGYLSRAVPLIAPLSVFEQYVSDPAKPVPYTDGVHDERTREYMTDDQRFASTRPDVLVFKTDTLIQDITLAGPLVADLMVSISGTDADFVVKLIDVFPDNFTYPNTTYVMNGYQMLVRGDIMRGKFRNSFEHPEPFVPNKATRVKYTLPDVAHTFKKGHRIMVQVQSSWFPLVDRNPQQFMDIYHAKDSDFKKATIKIYCNDSKVLLPVVQ